MIINILNTMNMKVYISFYLCILSSVYMESFKFSEIFHIPVKFML